MSVPIPITTSSGGSDSENSDYLLEKVIFDFESGLIINPVGQDISRNADNAFEIIHINEFTQEKIKAEQAKYCEDHTIGKKHALKKYDQFALNTSCFWGSTGSNIIPILQFHEIFVTKIMNKLHW